MGTGTKLDVRIVTLEPMHVASAHGFGPSPEMIAWDKILRWAGENGLLDGDEAPTYYGFDNPMPSPGSLNYGYEQWIVVGPDAVGNDEVTIKKFSGGMYAVTRCKLPQIGEAWKRLVAWREDSKYRCAPHECLEQMISSPDTPFDDMVLDIFLAIAE